MQVWCVDMDHNEVGYSSVETVAVCASENRALQYVFESTGHWITNREDGCLTECIAGYDWSICAVEVLE